MGVAVVSGDGVMTTVGVAVGLGSAVGASVGVLVGGAGVIVWAGVGEDELMSAQAPSRTATAAPTKILESLTAASFSGR